MPPGYTAFFLWTAAAILWWSGWRKETAEGIPDMAVAVFLAGWPLAALQHWPVGAMAKVNGAFAWTTFAMAALVWTMRELERWRAVSAGLLIASMLLAASSSPWLTIEFPNGASGVFEAIAAGAAACLLTGGTAEQIAAVTMALMLPELIHAVMPEGGSSVIGSSSWMAGWWIAVLSARLLALAMMVLQRLAKKVKQLRNS